MRWLFFLVLAFAACDGGLPSCPCADPSQICVYLNSSAPICLGPCFEDGGGCGSGQTCSCAPTCLSCGDCKPVCH
jgi:hypothetical protein